MKLDVCKAWHIANVQNKSMPQSSKIEGYLSLESGVGFFSAAAMGIVVIIISLKCLQSTLQESFQHLCELHIIICIPQRRKWKAREVY